MPRRYRDFRGNFFKKNSVRVADVGSSPRAFHCVGYFVIIFVDFRNATEMCLEELITLMGRRGFYCTSKDLELFSSILRKFPRREDKYWVVRARICWRAMAEVMADHTRELPTDTYALYRMSWIFLVYWAFSSRDICEIQFPNIIIDYRRLHRNGSSQNYSIIFF